MEHLYDLLGLLWIIYGSVIVLLGLSFMALQIVFWGGGPTSGQVLLLTLFYSASIVGGVMIRRRHRLARATLLVLGVLNLLSVPLGTVLGIYTLYVLLKRRRQTAPEATTE